MRGARCEGWWRVPGTTTDGSGTGSATGTAALSALLRAGTADDHRAAESVPFVDRLVGGGLAPGEYARYLRQLRVVYAALERAVDAAPERLGPLGALVAGPLRRGPALAADLAALAGDAGAGGDAAAPVLPAAREYADRVDAVGRTDPGALAAHVYTRYLGDLAGGQVVAAGLRATGVGDAALAFYRFDAPVPVLRRQVREALDALPLAGAARAAVVVEARRAFDHNRLLLLALGRQGT
ncbi:biliverdin-producing heme oxygenase [Cellulomonas endophytica]|uniref:biliverdin-producing heme oxygenase n=1 Tax=Cellulomonas endophytica TaxID=2494735 RepID=UPI00196A7B98|nr:biliverdin-producing heme oxygenase [Cellulomonas endophytica]